MSRAPKLGEVWTADDGLATEYTCIDAEPDAYGSYGWKRSAPMGSRKVYGTLSGLTPPKAEPPEWLKARAWIAVNVAKGSDRPFAACDFHATPDAAIAEMDHAPTVGAINVLTGEWVPRD